MLGLEGSLLGQTKVVALLLGELGEVDVEGAKVGEGDLLVELLGEHVHAQGVLLGVVPQLELGQNLRKKNQNGLNFLDILFDPKKTNLVGEGGGHDEAGVSHGAAEVDKTALGEQDDVLAVLQGEPVHLRLDVRLRPAVLLQPLDLGSNVQIKDSALKTIFCKNLKVYLDLAVKVTNVANNGVVLHLKGNIV